MTLTQAERSKRYRSKPATKAKTAVKAKEWKEKNPERMKLIRFKEHLKSRYGLTWEQYELLSESQDHVCAICKRRCATRERLVVDHCHKQGIVRGLLCGTCNSGIGFMKDSPKRPEAAAIYLGNRGVLGVTDIIGKVHGRNQRASSAEK